VILTNGNTLNVTMPEFAGKTGPAPLASRISGNSQDVERQRIIKALDQAKGQVGGPNGAAALLGLRRTTLQSRMRKYNIARQYR
jgi:formate hydrogenlyase transcriptional activator